MAVLVDADVLLDFRGLQFCLARTNEFLENQRITDFLGTPLGSSPRLLPLLHTVKPRINAYSVITALRAANRDVATFSFVEEKIATTVLTLFPWIPPPIAYVTNSDCVEKVVALRPGLVLVHLEGVAEELRTAGVSAVCVPVSKQQQVPMRSLLTVIPDLAPIAVDESLYWKSYFTLPIPIRLSGPVVHGFGKGSTELGFPTANIVPQQTRIAPSLVPGVYCGQAWVAGYPDSFPAAVSIGWNPQFENKEKTTEVHIVHRFEESFYGKKVTVRLMAYLRAEAAFASVQELVRAIEYDVRLAQEVLSHS